MILTPYHRVYPSLSFRCCFLWVDTSQSVTSTIKIIDHQFRYILAYHRSPLGLPSVGTYRCSVRHPRGDSGGDVLTITYYLTRNSLNLEFVASLPCSKAQIRKSYVSLVSLLTIPRLISLIYRSVVHNGRKLWCGVLTTISSDRYIHTDTTSTQKNRTT
jgi:hypothetical protein